MRPIYKLNNEYPRMVAPDRHPAYRTAGWPYSGEETKPLGYIPQVSHTYGYFEESYGIMNEHQVAIGESTTAATVISWPVGGAPKGPGALLHIDELSRIALERSTTAREAVLLMGALAEKYGFWGEAAEMAGAGEVLTVVDPTEGWVFQILGTADSSGVPGAVWAAQRVPDDHIAVVANCFTITKIDLSDSDNFLGSTNMQQVAMETGNWDGEGDFDFSAAFSPGEYSHPYYSSRRIWRIFDIAAPSLKLNPHVPADVGSNHPFPFSVKVDKGMSVRQVMELNRDHYQGTEFDLASGLASGPFNTPMRHEQGPTAVEGAWERPISMHRTSYSTVLQCRHWLPNSVGGVVYWGADAPETTVYVPFYAGVTHIPESFYTGYLLSYTRDSAWWAFDFVNNWANLRYNSMIQDVKQAQQQLEGSWFEGQQEFEARVVAMLQDSSNVEAAQTLINQKCNENAESVVQRWWRLADELIVKYNDGYINTPGAVGTAAGYPDWWLEAVGYEHTTIMQDLERAHPPLTGLEQPEMHVGFNGGALVMVAAAMLLIGTAVGHIATRRVGTAPAKVTYVPSHTSLRSANCKPAKTRYGPIGAGTSGSGMTERLCTGQADAHSDLHERL